jgi:DNA-binding transcriptional MerR regulator
MARLAETTLRTVRFYEEAEILRPIRRTEGGHRLFRHEELERLRLVLDMREAGIALDEVRSLLELKQRSASGGEAAREATAALGAFTADLRRKVEALGRLCGDLEASIAHAEACAGCEATDLFPHRCRDCGKLAARGPAPRAMRVLWGLGEGDPDRDPPAAE